MVFSTINANATTDATALTTAVVAQEDAADDAVEESASFHQELKKRFIEGGPEFMGIVLLCLILGLALTIERIVYLNLSTTNTKKLLGSIESALASGGVDAAKEVAKQAGDVAAAAKGKTRRGRKPKAKK